MSETRTVRLGDICQVVSGATPKTSVDEYWNGEINWVTPADLSKLSGAYISETPRKITKAGFNSCATNLLPENSVLLSSRAPIGHVAINTVPMATNQGFKSLIPGDQILPKFLYYWLIDHKEYLQSLGVGATFKELSKKTVENIKLDLPPLEEQAKQVEIRDLQSIIAQKRERQQELFEELSVTHHEQHFSQKDKFDWVKLKDVTSKIGSGATPKGGSQAYKPEGIALIRSMNVHDRKFVYDGLAFIDEKQAAALSSVEVKENDILLNITGASVARVCRVPEDVLPARVNQHVAIIRLKPDTIEPELLERYLTLPSIKKQLLKIATSGGATREAITKTSIQHLRVPIL